MRSSNFPHTDRQGSTSCQTLRDKSEQVRTLDRIDRCQFALHDEVLTIVDAEYIATDVYITRQTTNFSTVGTFVESWCQSIFTGNRDSKVTTRAGDASKKDNRFGSENQRKEDTKNEENEIKKEVSFTGSLKFSPNLPIFSTNSSRVFFNLTSVLRNFSNHLELTPLHFVP